MSNVIISPNMALPVPVVGQEVGPDWATEINACMSSIDSHSHVSGKGVPITPDAININADLPLNGNNLTSVRTTRYTSQAAAPATASDLNCTAVISGDYYYIDASGNVIRLTQGGAPAGATGTITGLPSGTASASFAATTFTFQSATSTPATLSGGSVVVAQTVASGKSVTISAAGTQPANYAMTLPVALPSVNSFLVSNSAGTLSFSDFYTVYGGTYTPAFTTGSNTNSVTPSKAFVTRIGAIVTVTGSIQVTAAGAGNTVMRFNLPIASAFVSSSSLAGQATAETTNVVAQIYAEPVNDVVEFLFLAGGLVSYTFYYTYSYEII